MRYERNRFFLESLRRVINSMGPTKQRLRLRGRHNPLRTIPVHWSFACNSVKSAWVAWFCWLGLPRAIRCPPTPLERNYRGREVVFKSRGQWILLSCEDIWTCVKRMVATSKVTLWCNLLKMESTRKYMEEISLRVLKDQGRRREYGPKREERTRGWKNNYMVSRSIIWFFQ